MSSSNRSGGAGGGRVCHSASSPRVVEECDGDAEQDGELVVE